jgi:hypothetical protein
MDGFETTWILHSGTMHSWFLISWFGEINLSLAQHSDEMRFIQSVLEA